MILSILEDLISWFAAILVTMQKQKCFFLGKRKEKIKIPLGFRKMVFFNRTCWMFYSMSRQFATLYHGIRWNCNDLNQCRYGYTVRLLCRHRNVYTFLCVHPSLIEFKEFVQFKLARDQHSMNLLKLNFKWLKIDISKTIARIMWHNKI